MAKNACWLKLYSTFIPGNVNEMLQVFKRSVSRYLSDVFGLVVYLGNCDAASSPLLFKKSFQQVISDVKGRVFG